ncbi:hypothetical protein ACHQM5_028836 [Ranunculus cassubicifolius]
MQLQSSVRKAMATTNMKPIFLLIVATLIPLCHSDSVLAAGGALVPGRSLTNCGFVLAMQSLCNLILLDGGRPIWSTGTIGRASNCYVAMQTNGNIVLYDYGNKAMWASNTNRAGSASYYLSLQCDRNLVIYTPQGTAIWATGTNRRLKGVMANGTTSTTSTKNTSGDLGVKSPGGKV